MTNTHLLPLLFAILVVAVQGQQPSGNSCIDPFSNSTRADGEVWQRPDIQCSRVSCDNGAVNQAACAVPENYGDPNCVMVLNPDASFPACCPVMECLPRDITIDEEPGIVSVVVVRQPTEAPTEEPETTTEASSDVTTIAAPTVLFFDSSAITGEPLTTTAAPNPVSAEPTSVTTEEPEPSPVPTEEPEPTAVATEEPTEAPTEEPVTTTEASSDVTATVAPTVVYFGSSAYTDEPLTTTAAPTPVSAEPTSVPTEEPEPTPVPTEGPPPTGVSPLPPCHVCGIPACPQHGYGFYPPVVLFVPIPYNSFPPPPPPGSVVPYPFVPPPFPGFPADTRTITVE